MKTGHTYKETLDTNTHTFMRMRNMPWAQQRKNASSTLIPYVFVVSILNAADTHVQNHF